MATVIVTERLILRTWKLEDAQIYFEINQDSKVIEFLRGPLTIEQVKYFILLANKHAEKLGYTLWAVELKLTGEFIGFIGLNFVDWNSQFTPAVEVAWRLGSQFWGCGYATEGAKAALDYGFKQCGLKKVVSFTVPVNFRSIHVMEKCGLKRDFDGDFLHPNLPEDHFLSRHVLYQLTSMEYLRKCNADNK